jgi:hypothetical protein
MMENGDHGSVRMSAPPDSKITRKEIRGPGGGGPKGSVKRKFHDTHPLLGSSFPCVKQVRVSSPSSTNCSNSMISSDLCENFKPAIKKKMTCYCVGWRA